MGIVLVVDDVKTDRDLIGKVVSSIGHKPIFATDGDEAVVVAKAEKPELILLDIVMPRVNGFNACRMLKTDSETAAIPIILVTSKTSNSDKYWGKKQGAEDHLAKPFSPDVLVAMIRRYLR